MPLWMSSGQDPDLAAFLQTATPQLENVRAVDGDVGVCGGHAPAVEVGPPRPALSPTWRRRLTDVTNTVPIPSRGLCGLDGHAVRRTASMDNILYRLALARLRQQPKPARTERPAPLQRRATTQWSGSPPTTHASERVVAESHEPSPPPPPAPVVRTPATADGGADGPLPSAPKLVGTAEQRTPLDRRGSGILATASASAPSLVTGPSTTSPSQVPRRANSVPVTEIDAATLANLMLHAGAEQPLPQHDGGDGSGDTPVAAAQEEHRAPLLILDVRPFLSFNRGHLRESINLNVPAALARRPGFCMGTLESRVCQADRPAFRNRTGHDIVLYDDAGTQADRRNSITTLQQAAAQLQAEGQASNVYILSGNGRAAGQVRCMIMDGARPACMLRLPASPARTRLAFDRSLQTRSSALASCTRNSFSASLPRTRPPFSRSECNKQHPPWRREQSSSAVATRRRRPAGWRPARPVRPARPAPGSHPAQPASRPASR